MNMQYNEDKRKLTDNLEEVFINLIEGLSNDEKEKEGDQIYFLTAIATDAINLATFIATYMNIIFQHTLS